MVINGNYGLIMGKEGPFKPKGLAQPFVGNDVGHLSSLMALGAQFEPPYVKNTSIHQKVY